MNFNIDKNDISLLVEETINRILSEINTTDNIPDVLYHFTTKTSARNIILYNFISLSSPTKKSATDSKINNSFGYYNHLSFTTDGNILTSPYPNQDTGKKESVNVRFSVMTEQLKQHKFILKHIRYSDFKANRIISYLNAGNQPNCPAFRNMVKYFIDRGVKPDYENLNNFKQDLYNKAKELDQKEVRIVSNRTSIQNFSNYVINVDFLLDDINGNDVIKSLNWPQIRREWGTKIRFFTNKQDFDDRTNFTTLENYEQTDDWQHDDDDIELTETTLSALATIFYCISYTSDGIDAIKKRANEYLSKTCFGHVYCSIDYDDGYSSDHETNLKYEVLKAIEEKNTIYSNGNKLYDDAKTAFNRIAEYLAKYRFILLDVTDMYIRWLKRYNKSVNNKIRKIKNDLNNVRLNNYEDLLKFSKKYTFVVKKLFSTKLGFAKAKAFMQSFDLLEARNRLTLFDLFKELFSIIPVSEFKKYILDTYANNIYHINELINFKSSVVKYRNNILTQIQTGQGRNNFGDLAILYNNADTANRENNL